MRGGREPCLLLVSPGVLKPGDTEFGLPHLVSLGGLVRHRTGARVELLDLDLEPREPRHLERLLEELGPFLAVGLSCYSTFDYARVMALGRFLKTLYPDVPLVTGGYHASAVPEDLLFDGSPFDVLVPGEGEEALVEVVEQRLGGGVVVPGIRNPAVVEDLDPLPPYAWDLLHRYWPEARSRGRKLQVYLSRGCPYECTFCMERAKSGHRWRAYSPERALDELERLATFTPLEDWVVNLADPLFGFDRAWRREVLRGIVDRRLLPWQYWTLTRVDDLGEEDVELLARARFSVGIGLESGSPRMLRLMQKTRDPERYLEALRRLARLSRKSGLTWAANLVLGHPGETRESMEETLAFATELVDTAEETCGWLSLDPFRLYPGSEVHRNMADYEARHGTRFHHPEWWRRGRDGPFLAEHLDPSSELDFAARVDFMHTRYPPLLERVARRFRGQGSSVDRVFRRSLEEQVEQVGEAERRRLLARAGRVARTPRVEWKPHLERYYRLWTHLPLPGDAADLSRPGGPAPDWVPVLQKAWREAPGRLLAQVFPLGFEDGEALLAFLDEPGLSDPADRSLCRLLARAFRESGTEPEDPGPARLGEELAGLLEALHGGPSPPLRVFSVPSLSAGDFTHGRATRVGAEGRIAVSFRCPPEQALLQVLHEAVHFASDPEVLERLPDLPHDTRAGSEGFAIHRALEEAAVDITAALLDAEAPHLLPAFARWRGLVGME